MPHPQISHPRLNWLENPEIRPYVMIRKENQVQDPGRLHGLDWFKGFSPLLINPFEMDEVSFGDQIMELDRQAFHHHHMTLSRWVFFDCAITPGLASGFAIKTSAMEEKTRKALKLKGGHEWTPLSLFITIPSMGPDGEWVAHNLCSANCLLPKEDRFYGLGFLSKAFGLWYANVKTCCGFTQWDNGALKLHSHYGPFQILTTYTPLHSLPQTLTYRVQVTPQMWLHFFNQKPMENFDQNFQASGETIEPRKDTSLIKWQVELEQGKGPYFLDPQEILSKKMGEPLEIHVPRL